MAAPKKRTPAKVTVSTPNVDVKPIPDFFDKIGNKAVFLSLGLIVLIEIIVFKDYFFDKVYVFNDIGSDTLNGAYPFMYQTADYISKYGIPKWSFHLGMGQNLFPFFLGDPFNILLYIAGKDHIMYGMIYKELAKILLGGVVFYYYLKTIKLSNFTSLAGSLLFAFCSFMIVGSGWYMFSFEALNMALLLLAFELFFTKQTWYLFPVPIFLMGISMPLNIYIYGLFLAIYAVLRLLQTDTFSIQKLSILYLKLAGLGLIGLLLSAPFLIETIAQFLASPRGNGSSSYLHKLASESIFNIADKLQLGTCIMRFFSSDILGTGSDFKGRGNFLEAPLFYCGLPCLLLLPQVFQFLDKRVKIAFAVFLGIWLLPLIFPWLRQAFWLFTGDYYRGYSLLVALVFLYYALQALEFIVQKKKINLIVLIATIVVLFILINYPFFDDNDVNGTVSLFVMVMLVAYGLILFFIPKQKNAVYLKWIFLAAVVFELIYLTSITVNEREALTQSELSQKKGYNDYTIDAVKYVQHHDKSFYRIDKSYSSAPSKYTSFNDAMVQGYYGSSCYNSFNQEHYIYYLESLGIVNVNDEYSTRSTFGVLGHFILEDENCVKYIFVKGSTAAFNRTFFDSLTQIGDVKILQNKFFVPLGFMYNYFIKESSFDSLSYLQKSFVSLRTCVVKDDSIKTVNGIKEFYVKDTIAANGFNIEVWGKEVNELKKDTLIISHFDPNHIKGAVTLNENKIMYLSIPYDDGWKLKVDGHATNKIILDAGMTGAMLEKGNHTIEMNYDLRFFYKGLYLCLAGGLIYAGLLFFTRRKPNSR